MKIWLVRILLYDYYIITIIITTIIYSNNYYLVLNSTIVRRVSRANDENGVGTIVTDKQRHESVSLIFLIIIFLFNFFILFNYD